MPFIPEHFIPPPEQRLARFSLTVLAPALAERDYAAVMHNADRIRHVFGPEHDWPRADMSFEQNLDDLRRHEREFIERKAFAYSLLGHGGSDRYYGCLYISPIKSRIDNDLRKSRFDAMVFLWLTSHAAEDGVEGSAFDDIAAWLRSDWPFRSLAFPGRTIAWDDWQRMSTEG